MKKQVLRIEDLEIGDWIQTLCNGVPEGRIFVVEATFAHSVILHNVTTERSSLWSFNDLFDNEVELVEFKDTVNKLPNTK